MAKITKESVKKFVKENWKELLLGGLGTTAIIIGIDCEHQISKHRSNANKNVDQINTNFDNVDEELDCLAHQINYLASKMDLPEDEWEPITVTNEDGTREA